MIEVGLTQEQETFKQLAATGRYINTGKVLIGVTHVPRAQEMSWEGVQVQSLLLGHAPRRMPKVALTYSALLMLVVIYALVACQAL